MRTRFSTVMITLFILIGLVACSLPAAQAETPDLVATWVAATLTAVDMPATLPAATPTPSAIPTASQTPAPSDTAAPTSTPQNPLILETTLCWKGPGAQYEVVSALKKDERVELIGQGSLAGWWIVDNPIYHDPCWAQARHIQVEPGYNTAALPIFTPPPSPTPSPTNTSVPTNTPTPTNTP
jgi:hypothetical protein